jgi:hypothetical protein
MGKKHVQPAKMPSKSVKKTTAKRNAPLTSSAAPFPVQIMNTTAWVISVIHDNKPLLYDESSILDSFTKVKAGRGWGKMEQAELFSDMSEAKYTKLFHHVFATSFGPSVARLQHNYIRSYYETLVTTARGKHGKLIAAALKRAKRAGKL